MKRTLQYLITVTVALLASLAVGQAATYTWNGSAPFDWFNPDNWSPSGVPGAADRAIINSGTVDLTADADVADLEMRGGTVAGPGSLTISNALSWTGGTMNGPGSLVIAAGAQGELAPLGQVVVDGCRVENAGTVVWTNSSFYLQSGVWSNAAGGVLEIQGDYQCWDSDGGSQGEVHNGGLVRKSAGTGTAQFTSVRFRNTGTLEIESGTLYFDQPYVQTTGSTILRGGNLTTPNGVDIQGGSLGGSGTITAKVTCSGLVNPGDPVGVLRIVGEYVQTASAALTFKWRARSRALSSTSC